MLAWNAWTVATKSAGLSTEIASCRVYVPAISGESLNSMVTVPSPWHSLPTLVCGSIAKPDRPVLCVIATLARLT